MEKKITRDEWMNDAEALFNSPEEFSIDCGEATQTYKVEISNFKYLSGVKVEGMDEMECIILTHIMARHGLYVHIETEGAE